MKARWLAEDRIGMVDRRHHVPLRCQILREPGHECPGARISMGYNHQRKCRNCSRLAHRGGPCPECRQSERQLAARRAWRFHRLRALPGVMQWLASDLDRERPIVQRRLSGVFVEPKNIRLTRIDQINGATPTVHRLREASSGASAAWNAEVRCRVLLGEGAGACRNRMPRSFISPFCVSASHRQIIRND